MNLCGGGRSQTGSLRYEVRLAPGWTFKRLERELQRRVSNEVRRLHKLKETQLVRSEWDVLAPDANNEPRSVLKGIIGPASSGASVDRAERQAEGIKNARVSELLGDDDPPVSQLFCCLCGGVSKRRAIAARLGTSAAEVTNCRKRLNRRLDELMKKEAGGGQCQFFFTISERTPMRQVEQKPCSDPVPTPSDGP
jgi:hypothetical protein